MKYYIVFTQPRSGTHLLRHLMRGVGAGNPREHLFFLLKEDKNIDSVKMLYRGGMKGGVWGGSIHWKHYIPGMERLKKILGLEDTENFEVLNTLFPDIKFIHLHRLNKIKQAISYIKACQSGVFSHSDSEQAKDFNFRYSKEEIEKTILTFSEWEARWLDLTKKYNIEPHVITYEDLCAKPAKVLQGILEFLGVSVLTNEPFEEYIQKSELPIRQYNTTSENWYQRYLNEMSRK